MPTGAIAGLYAITDAQLQDASELAQRVERVLAGGARVIQYRDKGGDGARRHAEAQALAALCRRYRACFIVNDDVRLAAAVGADGVHLGKDDPALEGARETLGPEALIGVSCYADLQRARRLAAAGADYLAFGSVFPSATKPQAADAGLATLRRARAEFSLPLVAIGGIGPENAAAAVAAGADAVAVIRGVFDCTDPAVPAAAIARIFDRPD